MLDYALRQGAKPNEAHADARIAGCYYLTINILYNRMFFQPFPSVYHSHVLGFHIPHYTS